MNEKLLNIEYFSRWLASGERGLSSQAIVSHLTGVPVGRYSGDRKDHPYDPDDFRRCQLLLDTYPLARLAFPAMRTASPTWARLVDTWDEIHAAIESECPGYVHNPQHRSAPLGYALICRVRAGGVECSDCDGAGRASPCDKCKGTGSRSGGRCRADSCRRGFTTCKTCHGNGYTLPAKVDAGTSS